MDPAVPLRIDFVSDVACPWCAIGLASLQQALARLEPGVKADIHLLPFELNPDLPPEGEDATEGLMRKYGIDEEQLDASRNAIRERAASLGVVIDTDRGSRAWNTFDAHRLLHWAGRKDLERALEVKKALFRAYFGDNENVADHDVLVRIAGDAGLDAGQARRMLDAGEFSEKVRSQERICQQAGIHSVPATIVNRNRLIPGGQPPEVFEEALREIVAGMSAPG